VYCVLNPLALEIEPGPDSDHCTSSDVFAAVAVNVNAVPPALTVLESGVTLRLGGGVLGQAVNAKAIASRANQGGRRNRVSVVIIHPFLL
jgi:hypothetical protein